MPDTPLNPDALEAAAKELFLEDENTAYVKYPEWDSPENVGKPVYIENARAAVSAYLAAALPEVAEREQLTELPDKIVLEDRRGTIWQRINGNWYTPGSKHDYSEQSVMLPARVLYRPEVKP